MQSLKGRCIMPEISVIVPVYNAEPYLEKCLKSLLLQTYENLEIICVNDGSTDNSAKILEKYAALDRRIVVIEKENGGAASARNRGLEAATGDYVSFVDADDWVNLTLFETFAASCRKVPVDVWIFNLGICFKKNMKTLTKNSIKLEDWDGWESPDSVLTFDNCNNPFYSGMSVCNKIYSLDFLRAHNLRFYEGIIFEDTLFNIKTLLIAKSLKINPEVFYWYNQANVSSVTKSYDEKVFDAFIVIDEIKKCLQQQKLTEIYKYAFFQYKYDSLATLYKQTKRKWLKKFYNKMKDYCIIPSEFNSLDKNLCKHLKNYIIIERLQSSDWHEFYKFLQHGSV